MVRVKRKLVLWFKGSPLSIVRWYSVALLRPSQNEEERCTRVTAELTRVPKAMVVECTDAVPCKTRIHGRCSERCEGRRFGLACAPKVVGTSACFQVLSKSGKTNKSCRDKPHTRTRKDTRILRKRYRFAIKPQEVGGGLHTSYHPIILRGPLRPSA